ncbi:hypothetical protein [Marinobacterium stanieri]|uniref:Uncharacterized protein n=1 Tax=Marinobacterium stanieri TaxID=49186 RepID=A0A1N6RN51_9GAMM|nr:hypothetical protein [Marinobacterium stanieri]SIQ30231.1 hypothetical protein SAMN05421647_103427 [Marinobacterium stanieri]
MSLPGYYIVDLKATREANQVMFMSRSLGASATPAAGNAVVFSEEVVNGDTELYDNGETTRAVLRSTIHQHTGDLMALLHGRPEPHEEEMIA